MSTTTVSRPLAEIYAERWRTSDQRSQISTDDSIGDALFGVYQAMAGDYWQIGDEHDPTWALNPEPLASKWLDELRAEIERVGKREWEAHVIPAVIEVLMAKLPTAPEHLRVFPGSEQLRADLEAL